MFPAHFIYGSYSKQAVNCLFYFCLYVFCFFSLFFSGLRCMCSSINIENPAKLWKVHPCFDPSKSVLVLRNDLEWSVQAQCRDCLDQMVVTITLILFFLISLRFVLFCQSWFSILSFYCQWMSVTQRAVLLWFIYVCIWLFF